MEEKFCKGCNKYRDVANFSKKGKWLQSKCKSCQNEYHKKHYKDNIKGYKDRAKKRNKVQMELIRKFIQDQKDKPCQDCKKDWPYYVMDFDHREGEEKLHNVSQMASEKLSLEAVKKEISKCDIVCSNCHRIRTYNRTKTA